MADVTRARQPEQNICGLTGSAVSRSATNAANLALTQQDQQIRDSSRHTRIYNGTIIPYYTNLTKIKLGFR